MPGLRESRSYMLPDLTEGPVRGHGYGYSSQDAYPDGLGEGYGDFRGTGDGMGYTQVDGDGFSSSYHGDGIFRLGSVVKEALEA